MANVQWTAGAFNVNKFSLFALIDCFFLHHHRRRRRFLLLLLSFSISHFLCHFILMNVFELVCECVHFIREERFVTMAKSIQSISLLALDFLMRTYTEYIFVWVRIIFGVLARWETYICKAYHFMYTFYFMCKLIVRSMWIRSRFYWIFVHTLFPLLSIHRITRITKTHTIFADRNNWNGWIHFWFGRIWQFQTESFIYSVITWKNKCELDHQLKLHGSARTKINTIYKHQKWLKLFKCHFCNEMKSHCECK